MSKTNKESNCQGPYEAMVLSCIDPRMQQPVTDYLNERGLEGKYSHVCIAGAAIGAVAPRFENWHQTFWENLRISLQLHKITKVIVLQHWDCGAAKEAYDRFKQGGKAEVKLHRAVVATFAEDLRRHQPQLQLEAFLIDQQGKTIDLLRGK